MYIIPLTPRSAADACFDPNGSDLHPIHVQMFVYVCVQSPVSDATDVAIKKMKSKSKKKNRRSSLSDVTVPPNWTRAKRNSEVVPLAVAPEDMI